MNKLKKKNQNINMKKFYLIETSFIISININDDNSLIYNNFASYTFNNEYFFFWKIIICTFILQLCQKSDHYWIYFISIIKYRFIRIWNSSFEYRNSIIQNSE